MPKKGVRERMPKKGDGLTSKAENDMISHSLIILQATVGWDRPTKSEFELCAQKVIAMVPEMKDPIPSINKSAFKQWVSTSEKLSVSRSRTVNN